MACPKAQIVVSFRFMKVINQESREYELHSGYEKFIDWNEIVTNKALIMEVEDHSSQNGKKSYGDFHRHFRVPSSKEWEQPVHHIDYLSGNSEDASTKIPNLDP